MAQKKFSKLLMLKDKFLKNCALFQINSFYLVKNLVKDKQDNLSIVSLN